MRFSLVLLLSVTLTPHVAIAFGPNCGTNYDNNPESIQIPPASSLKTGKLLSPKPNLRITYMGDSGYQPVADDVLNTVARFDPELVVHVGDFDYRDDPARFMNMIDRTVGPDQKYLVHIGNHELKAWDGPRGYQARFQERHERNNVTDFCFGELGVMEVCIYDGLLIMLLGAGTRGSGFAKFIDDVFTEYADVPYKVCTWHKNQRLMQIAYKRDEVGWDVYEMCVAHGAMVVNGHSHTYSRTYAMSSFQRQVVTDRSQGTTIDNPIVLTPGQSFLFVTGLGGRDYYEAEAGRHLNPWWASVLTNNINPNVDHGPTNCIYNINDSGVAFCQQIGQRDGRVFDQFYFTSRLDASPVRTPAQILAASRAAERSDRVESQIHGGGEHAFYADEGCSVVVDSDTLTVSKGRSVILQFPDMELNGKLSAAQLQVYSGAVNMVDGVEVLPDHPLTAYVSLVDREAAGRCKFSPSKGAKSFSWTIKDYESSEVWPSPDFASIVLDLIEEAGPVVASSKVLQIELASESEYEFFRTECLAPTLAFTYTS